MSSEGSMMLVLIVVGTLGLVGYSTLWIKFGRHQVMDNVSWEGSVVLTESLHRCDRVIYSFISKDAEGHSLDESLEMRSIFNVDSCDSIPLRNVNNDSVLCCCRLLSRVLPVRGDVRGCRWKDCLEKNLEDDVVRFWELFSGDCGMLHDDNEDVTLLFAPKKDSILGASIYTPVG
ncbi:hypothetical protein Tco_0957569 [Tanacetum coccineum]